MSTNPSTIRGRARRLLAVPVLMGLIWPLTVPTAAIAAPVLTVTRITWNVIGLDSNNVMVGPNIFPVGVRVCNTGDAPATNLDATFVWDSANAYVNVSGSSSLASPQLPAGACTDFSFDVVITRSSSAYNTVRQYHIEVSADGLGPVSTPTPREVYVEKLVSQNRNDITSITGPTTVYVGETYDFTLVASTATNGYEQLEAFLNFPNLIFRMDAVDTSYSAPAGGTNDKVYANACGWDNVPTSPTYRSCIGPAQYTGGKAGGDITTTFTVTILSAGAANLTALIYDFSGSSYHYNSDFGVEVLSVTALPSADLSMTKTDTSDPVVAGEEITYVLSAANAGPSDASSVSVSDVLPAGSTFVAASGVGWTCVHNAGTVTCTRPALAAGATAPDINVRVTAPSAGGSITNTASVSSSTSDPDGTNNSDSEGTTVTASADLGVSTTDTPDPAPATSAVDYVMTVTNHGVSDATGITVTDTIPAGTTFVSASGNGWTCNEAAGIVTCTRPALAAGASAPDITVSVTAPATGGTITNNASVAAAQGDPDPSNNDDAEDTLVEDPPSPPANDPPVAVDDSANTPTDTPVAIGVTANDTDPDGNLDPSTVQVTSGPANGGVSCAANGVCTYTPDPGFSGTDTFDYEVCDTDGACDTGTVTVDVAAPPPPPPVNNPPVAVDDSASTPAGTPVAIGVTANDSDPEGDLDPSTVQVTAAPSNGLVLCDVSGVCTYTPDPGFNGADSFQYEVCDTDGACDTADVSITVDASADLELTSTDAPDPVDDGNDVDYTLTVTNNGPSDATGLEVTDVLPAGASFVSAGGTDWTCSLSGAIVTCTRGALASGATAPDITVTVTAASGPTTMTNSAWVTANEPDPAAGNNADTEDTDVLAPPPPPVNNPPVATDDSGTTTTDTPVVIGVTANDSDPDGNLDPSTVTATNGPTNGSVLCDANGVCTYTPDPGFTGSDGFEYEVCDTDGACDTGSVSITVSAPPPPPNNPPVATDDSGTTTTDTPVAIGVSANDSDPDGNLDPSTVTVTNGPTNGSVLCDAAGVCTYTPGLGFTGSDQFDYQVCDTDGACDTGTVFVTVNAVPLPPPVNNPPVATDDSATTTMITPVAIGVTANDSDPDGNLDPSTVQVTSGPANGGVSCAANGVCTYTPTSGFTGTDTFDYQVCDTNGLCDTGSVSITVSAPPPPPNNPPVAVDDSGTTAADTPVAIGVTANDSDPDGNLDPSTVQVTTGPANGTVSCAANGVCTYTPIAGFSGTDSFTYEICDAAGACDTASVTITVAAPQAPAPTPTPTPNPSPTPTPTAEVPVVPPPPSLNAVDDSAETSPNTAIVIEVELNDEIPSRNAVRLIDNTEARDGSVECTARGVCTYSPGESNTSDVFDYTICIEGNPCDSARVRIRVLRPGAVESATAAEAIDGTLPFTGQPIAALLLLMLFSLTLGSSLLYASRPRTPVAPAMARVERGPATGVWTFAFPPSE